MDYKVIKGKTLKQYNEKYKTLRHVLVSLSKKEVDDFDKKHNSNELSLLNKKNWWLIDNTYYEIPKPIRWVWFRNLSKKIQAATYVALGAILLSTIGTTTYLVIKSKMVTEDEWYNAINEVNDITKNRNYTFTGEFDAKLASNSSDVYRVKETVYVVNNEEHVIKNIIKPNQTITSELCYKIIDSSYESSEFVVKYKNNDGVWSNYEQAMIYDLPSYEFQEISSFKHIYSAFKFNGDSYTYFIPASETNPSLTYSLKFKHKKLVRFSTQQNLKKDYRKFEFSNYGKTSLNI